MVAALLHSGGDGLARACARAGCVVLVVVLCGARSGAVTGPWTELA